MEEGCVYCPQGQGVMIDHVPPSACFFEIPPLYLIKVPCCNSCLKRHRANDEQAHGVISPLLLCDGEMRLEMLNVVHINHGRILDALFERVSRAVLYHVSKKPYFDSAFTWRLDLTTLPSIFEAQRHGSFRVSIGDSFSAYVVPDSPFVLLVFHKRLFIVGKFR